MDLLKPSPDVSRSVIFILGPLSFPLNNRGTLTDMYSLSNGYAAIWELCIWNDSCFKLEVFTSVPVSLFFFFTLTVIGLPVYLTWVRNESVSYRVRIAESAWKWRSQASSPSFMTVSDIRLPFLTVCSSWWGGQDEEGIHRLRHCPVWLCSWSPQEAFGTLGSLSY